MITMRSAGGGRVKVTFRIVAGDGHVAVAGDLNDWDPTATPLRTRGEHRSASIELQPGERYQFRYRDEHGRWFNDDAADAYEVNGFGEMNCVIDLTDH
jgi:1,4-alpha-glucan branching enzyme